MMLTPFLVPTPDITLLTNMLVIYATISVAGAVLFIALAKEKPKLFRYEASKEEVKTSISLKDIKGFFGKKDFIILEALFFIGVGLFTALLTWLETILNTRGLTATNAGIIGGIFGSLVIPGFSDMTAPKQKRNLTINLS